MSYDIDVFSVRSAIVPRMPSGHGWQVAAHGPLKVEPEDIPADVRKVVPGVQYLVQLHLEGDAPTSAFAALFDVARALARSSRGVVVDQQEGTVETPRGVRRLEAGARPAESRLLQMSWFTTDSERFVATASGELLDTLERTLPEGLPRRYGLSEPPQFNLAQEGLQHFRTFLAGHLHQPVVWYCHKPCRHVFVEVPHRVGATARGFRCNRLTVDIEAVVIGDPAWRLELVRLWLAVADLLRPFYAEIRDDACPTTSWWNGIPKEAASAVLLGPPYHELWTEFGDGAQISRGGLVYREQMSSGAAADTPQIPRPPDSIAQPSDTRTEVDPRTGEILSEIRYNDIQYPPTWPFEGPRSSSR
jgi:hypothetical protein